MFTSVVLGIKHGPFKTFTEAFVNFLPRVVAMAAAGNSMEMFETCWIEGEFPGEKIPMRFFDARDFAYDVGVLVGDGDFANPLPEVDPADIRIAFLECSARTMAKMESQKQGLLAMADATATDIIAGLET